MHTLEFWQTYTYSTDFLYIYYTYYIPSSNILPASTAGMLNRKERLYTDRIEFILI